MQKRIPYRNNKIRKAAKDEACTMQGPNCNGGGADTVFCHLNEYWAGKGAGQKADDCAGFFGCHNCHVDYDGNRLHNPEFYVLRAYYRTIRRLLDKGVLT